MRFFFPGKFCLYVLQTNLAIAPGSENNVFLRHSSRHLLAGGAPCSGYYSKNIFLVPTDIYMNPYEILPVSGIWSGAFLCLARSMRLAELEFTVENSLVQAPQSGGGGNAPRPAVSVLHIDVNADGCRARKARSCKNTAFRGGI